jgi:hypothetical protein
MLAIDLRSEKKFLLSHVVAEEPELPTVKTQVQLTGRARAVLDSLRDETGMPQTEAIARLFEWFAAQDLKFRQAILLRSPEASQEMARLALRHMAGLAALVGDKATGTTLADQSVGELSKDEAASAAHALIEQVHALINNLHHRASLEERRIKRQQAKGG